jgi:two-component system chemotaxis response regulator CheY
MDKKPLDTVMSHHNAPSPKRVLSVGQCVPDQAAIHRLIHSNFEAEVVTAIVLEDALSQLRASRFDLVLVNRKLDADYSDGIDVLRAIKADPQLADVPVMLITNYAEHQQLAVADGAEPGFGKLEYTRPETLAKLQRFLG